ncbi:hydroxyethylthiazole kinase [Robertmurraya korlensis]|uniref:hydroxyethylthiazole kinase n=1 Tax=Robertmurraya korlensis TaxID=519977 RepID=UPI00203E2F90|nr:hydroxyethylthiazole kinase [Robertmurraya korlensis]MCM3601350.1 hydroxyethylthiazole kinase [Robertmurraya korlensis]
MSHDFLTLIDRVREQSPLVHNMTNVVVTNFVANGLLALGASPVMAYAKEEVADMVSIANSLVLNIGTLREPEVEAMITAGKAANVKGVPVVLDPVGAGATPYRTNTVNRLLTEVNISILRGNAAEVANVIGEEWQTRGVDAGTGEGNIEDLARIAAQKLHMTVVVTGKDDVVSNGEESIIISNGHPLLTKVTGTGCLFSSVVGAFASVEANYLLASAGASAFYGAVAERAILTTGDQQVGTFQMEFLNQLMLTSSSDVVDLAKVYSKVTTI